MDVDFSPEDMKFRQEVRDFIAKEYPHAGGAGKRRTDMGKEGLLAWHKILHAKGWVAPSWPVEHGGTGWSVTQRYIWGEENALADTVPVLPFGVTMLGPVVYTYGTKAQKEWVLPAILSGEHWWCQGYSEPGAGSDLASLRTVAVRDGDSYVVNGHKTWTTLAQYADWIFCLVRTKKGVKPQEGISFLLIDMQSPGVTVRPIVTMDGGAEINEVFLEDVRVPAENLVGEENQGWTLAKFLLGNERSGIAGVARSKRALALLRGLVNTPEGSGVIQENSGFCDKMDALEIDLTALEYTELRTLAAESKGSTAGPESSLLKIKGTEIQQRLTELTLTACGYYALPWAAPSESQGKNYPMVGPESMYGATQQYLNTRKVSIYGGTNEIQRNIIAKMVLGL